MWNKRYVLIHARNLKKIDFTKLFCFIMVLIGAGMLLINIIFNGKIMQDLFFKDPLDTGMDFYTMVAASFKPLLVRLSEITSFYPPLALAFFRVVYLCIPTDISSQWPTEGTWSEVLRGNSGDPRIFSEAVYFYLLFLIVCSFLIFSYLVSKKGGITYVKILFAGCCFFTYGMLFAVERGNIVLLSLPLLMLFLALKDSDNKYLLGLALFALVLSAGIKLYPALFGVLLLVEKRFKEAIVSAILGLTVLCVPLLSIGGVEGLLKYLSNISTFSEGSGFGTLTGFSLQVIVKAILYLAGIENSKILQYIQFIAYALLIWGCLLCFVVREKWKKLTLLTIILMVVPGTSMPYVSIFLLIPFVEFLNAEEGQKHSLISWIYFILFLLLLLPFSVPNVLNFEPYSLTSTNFIRQISTLVFTILVFGDCTISVFIRKRFKYEN